MPQGVKFSRQAANRIMRAVRMMERQYGKDRSRRRKERHARQPQILEAKVTESGGIAANGSGSVEIWRNGSASGVLKTAYNDWAQDPQALAIGTKINISWIRDREKWVILPDSTSQDIKVKVNTNETNAGFLQEQIQHQAVGGSKTGDGIVYHTAAVDNDTMELFIPTGGHSSGVDQYLYHDTSQPATWKWTTLPGASGDDIYVKFSSTDSDNNYLMEGTEAKLNQVSATKQSYDPQLRYEKGTRPLGGEYGTLFIDSDGDINYWTTSVPQLLGKDTANAWQWWDVTTFTTTAQTAGDMTVSVHYTGNDLNPYIDSSAYTNFGASGDKLLGYSHGNARFEWFDKTTTIDTDEKFSIFASETPGYWRDQVIREDTVHAGTGGDLLVEWYTNSTTVDMHINSHTFTNFGSTGDKILGYSHGNARWEWFNKETVTDTDELFSIYSGETPGYWRDQILREDTVQGGTNGDLLAEWYTSGGTVDIHINSHNYYNFGASGDKILGYSHGNTRFEWFDKQTVIDTDEKFSIYSGETPGYWRDQILREDTVHGGTSGDLLVEWYTGGTSVDQHVNSHTFTNFGSGGDKLLGYSHGNARWEWFDKTTTIDTDQYVGINSADTPGYLDDKFQNYDTSWDAVFDYPCNWHINGTGANQIIEFYIDSSEYYNHITSRDQYLGHNSGGRAWFDAGQVKVSFTDSLGYLENQFNTQTGVGNTGGDITVEMYSNGSVITPYFGPDRVPGSHGGGTKALGSTDGVNWSWVTFAGGSGPDIYVQVSATDSTSSGLNDKISGTSGTTYNSFHDLALHKQIEGGAGNPQTFRLFIDADQQTGIDSHNPNTIQGFGHNASGAWGWYDPGLTKVQSNDSLQYLQDQFTPMSTLPGGQGDMDAQFYNAGGIIGAYVDVSNYIFNVKQVLTHPAGADSLQWGNAVNAYRCTLTSGVSGGIAFADIYTMGGSLVATGQTVRDPQDLFDRGNVGSLGIVIQADDGLYYLVACQQQAIIMTATLSSRLQSADATGSVSGVQVASPEPFNLSVSISTVYNPYGLAGPAGRQVLLVYNYSTQTFVVAQVQHSSYDRIMDIRLNTTLDRFEVLRQRFAMMEDEAQTSDYVDYSAYIPATVCP